jgi:phosphoglycerate dehydrogenase-like enzyme
VIDIWIPQRTRAEHRRLLPDGIVLHELGETGPLPEHLGRCDFFVAAFDPPRVIDALPRFSGLQVVQSLNAGVEGLVGHIPPGVTLCDGSGIPDIGVAEWAVMVMLAMRRRLPGYIEAQRTGTWQPAPSPAGGVDLDGATVLIVGYGSIGRVLEQRVTAFGARVERVARRPRDGVHGVDALPALLPTADVVVILLPVTPSTRGFIDAAFLAAMRRGALLVNASRGAVVDTGALVAALHDGHVTAALDVTDPEPLPDGHPLWSAPGVLITPHVAGSVQAWSARAWRFTAQQVQRFVRGEPLLNVVVDGY